MAGRFSRDPVFVTKNYIQWSGGLVYRTCDFKGSTNRFRKNMSIIFNPCWRWFTVLCFCQSDMRFPFFITGFIHWRDRAIPRSTLSTFSGVKKMLFQIIPIPRSCMYSIATYITSQPCPGRLELFIDTVITCNYTSTYQTGIWRESSKLYLHSYSHEIVPWTVAHRMFLSYVIFMWPPTNIIPSGTHPVCWSVG